MTTTKTTSTTDCPLPTPREILRFRDEVVSTWLMVDEQVTIDELVKMMSSLRPAWPVEAIRAQLVVHWSEQYADPHHLVP